MTDTLEAKLRALADSGNFSHLSIIATGTGFHASFSPASTWGRGMHLADDPVEAALMAIEHAPKEEPHKRVKEVKVVQKDQPKVEASPMSKPKSLLELFK